MKITELHIGNLVTDEFYDNFKTIIKVDSINELGINLEIKDDGNYPELSKQWIVPDNEMISIRPIPISEELLLKLGAVKFEYKDIPSFNLHGLQINYINEMWIEYVSRVEITGLHHLQNIYFFRKSEELIVNI